MSNDQEKSMKVVFLSKHLKIRLTDEQKRLLENLYNMPPYKFSVVEKWTEGAAYTGALFHHKFHEGCCPFGLTIKEFLRDYPNGFVIRGPECIEQLLSAAS